MIKKLTSKAHAYTPFVDNARAWVRKIKKHVKINDEITNLQF